MQKIPTWLSDVVVRWPTEGLFYKNSKRSLLEKLGSGFPQALEIMENLENHEKKVPCMEKS